MRAFACPTCDLLVLFESSQCVRCGSELGFEPVSGEVVAGPFGPEAPWTRCANSTIAACNWVVDPRGPHQLCLSCRLTATRPDDGDPEVHQQFLDTESAKRRLVFNLLEVGLPVTPRADDPSAGLAFDLLSSRHGPVTIGHDDGLISLDLEESDDAHREQVRNQLHEPYRTMLGHLRHEVGHYYWTILVEGTDDLGRFRELFGDEQADYQAAIDRHYAQGPPPGWPDRFVSAYATMHPWEDWAESFAHYLHIRATLQTAAAYNMVVLGPDTRARTLDPTLVSAPEDDVDDRSFEAIVAQWLPLTYALNAINRSMGDDDLYPFVLTPPVIEKIGFIHDLVGDQKVASP